MRYEDAAGSGKELNVTGHSYKDRPLLGVSVVDREVVQGVFLSREDTEKLRDELTVILNHWENSPEPGW